MKFSFYRLPQNSFTSSNKDSLSYGFSTACTRYGVFYQLIQKPLSEEEIILLLETVAEQDTHQAKAFFEFVLHSENLSIPDAQKNFSKKVIEQWYQ